MTDDRAPFREARDAGKAIHQQQRLTRGDVAVIKRALQYIPATCHYHGENLTRDPSEFLSGPCCDTGKPSLARRYAEDALQRLETP